MTDPDFIDEPEDLWEIIDNRSGKPVTIVCFKSKTAARRQIKQWYNRDLDDKHERLHELLPYLEARLIELTPELPGPYDPTLSPKQRPCPSCLAKIGESCTAPTDTGRKIVNWTHYARENRHHES